MDIDTISIIKIWIGVMLLARAIRKALERKCPYCKKALPERDAKVCPYCGHLMPKDGEKWEVNDEELHTNRKS